MPEAKPKPKRTRKPKAEAPAPIGHNRTPHEVLTERLEDVRLTGADFLDGAPVETQGQADCIAAILNGAKEVRKDADAERVREKKPHDDAAKAVQSKWKPLLDRCEAIVKAAQAALTPFLRAEEARKAQEAAEERKAALEAQRKADEAARNAGGNLLAQESAQRLQTEADEATRNAARAQNMKAHAKGGVKATGLRTRWSFVIESRDAVLAHLIQHDAPALSSFVEEYVRRAVNAGVRTIPGARIFSEKAAV